MFNQPCFILMSLTWVDAKDTFYIMITDEGFSESFYKW